MNLPDNEIEARLRAAPQPQPPAGLKSKLLATVTLPTSRNSQHYTLTAPRPWWIRWWPSLAAGGLTAVCLVVVGAQQSQIRQMQQSIQELQQKVSGTTRPAAKPAANAATDAANLALPNGRAELAQLRQAAAALAGEVQALENLKVANQQLRSRPALQGALDTEEIQALQSMKDKASRIMCVNNLKQLGLAVRIWETDHGDQFPPDVLSLRNEAGGSTKLLVCPADSSRQAAESWAVLSPANISYEYLAASGNPTEPQRVMFRCPIHGNVALCDGSVQQAGLDHPERFTQRDGKLYFGEPSAALPAAANGMSPEMMRRYGLTPPPQAAPATEHQSQ